MYYGENIIGLNPKITENSDFHQYHDYSVQPVQPPKHINIIVSNIDRVISALQCQRNKASILTKIPTHHGSSHELIISNSM